MIDPITLIIVCFIGLVVFSVVVCVAACMLSSRISRELGE